MYKVLCIVVFKGFKAVCVYGVVLCKDNDKVVECSNNGVTGGVGCGDRLVCGCGWIGEGSQELREPPRTLYPNQNCRVYDTILTELHTLIIHKTAYSILIILIIYQDKKIG